VFAIYGDGSNGKSTWRETLFALLGDYAIGSDATLLVTTKRSGGATPDLARLVGRRLVTINETEQGAVLNEGRLKYITGSDKITARDLYETFFDFTPSHKTIITTNHKPIVQGIDEGLWRRIHAIVFELTIPASESNKNFRAEKLLPELSGILNYALEGLKEYYRIGLAPPQEVRDAIKEYREDMDIIGRWIEERCALDPEAEERSMDLYQDYSGWAAVEVGFPLSAIAFGRNLADRGFETVKVLGSRGFRGLKLRGM
jgi:putative DNA primase/helicase